MSSVLEFRTAIVVNLLPFLQASRFPFTYSDLLRILCLCKFIIGHHITVNPREYGLSLKRYEDALSFVLAELHELVGRARDITRFPHYQKGGNNMTLSCISTSTMKNTALSFTS